MEELKDLTIVIRNLTQARAFFIEGTQARKEKTAKALEGSVRRAIDTADGLADHLVHSNANDDKLMSAGDSQALIEYLPLRREVLVLFEQQEKAQLEQEEAAALDKTGPPARDVEAAEAAGVLSD